MAVVEVEARKWEIERKRTGKGIYKKERKRSSGQFPLTLSFRASQF